ncbi:MAG: lipopolysaccharide biosynthesis protein [Mucilaginibacter sp.]
MFSFIRSKIQFFWGAGHERTLLIKKNILYSFFIKGASVLVSFILVPLTIHYVNSLQYGIWITISSLVAWMNTFDIGLSNGLRNKIAHSLAMGENENIIKYISTTYASLLLIACSTFAIFFIVGSFFNWDQLLNIDKAINFSIWPIILITLGAFCIQFFLQPINSILIATHQPFKSSLILFLGQLLTLILIFILTKTATASLQLLVLVAAGSPLFVYVIANIFLFNTSLKAYKPRLRFVDFSSAKRLLNVGSAFFFIQMGALILYETDNIVIAKTLGPQDVTIFNIAYKPFSVLMIAFSIVITPYWSAFTDAYAKKDMLWIKQSIRKMRFLCLYIFVAALLLCASGNIFYKLWIGDSVVISYSLSFSLAIMISVQSWQVIHAYMLNGIGKLRMQLILIVGTGILNIPLSVFLIHYTGIPGTVIANIAMLIIMDVVFTYQCNLIIDQKATGIWER